VSRWNGETHKLYASLKENETRACRANHEKDGTHCEDVSQKFCEAHFYNASQSRYEAHFLLCESFLGGRREESYG